ADALSTSRHAAEDPAGSGVVIHVVTRKGAGYDRAAADAVDHWHASVPFEIAPPTEGEVSPPLDAPAPATTWTAVLGQAVLEGAREDPRVLALSAAMVDPVGLTAMQREMPERV